MIGIEGRLVDDARRIGGVPLQFLEIRMRQLSRERPLLQLPLQNLPSAPRRRAPEIQLTRARRLRVGSDDLLHQGSPGTHHPCDDDRSFRFRGTTYALCEILRGIADYDVVDELRALSPIVRYRQQLL